MLADITYAEVHPSTISHPGKDAQAKRKAMHIAHTALMGVGKLREKRQERKEVSWPFRAERVSVLGYGGEKIAYRVNTGEGSADSVVSVFHMASFGQSPESVIESKMKNYGTYMSYFGDAVVPSSFIILDNPWGDGSKAALVQLFINNAQRLSDLRDDDLKLRMQQDVQLQSSVLRVADGYKRMISDGLCPDLSSSNVLIQDSKVRLFDTGLVFSAERHDKIAAIRPNYATLQQFWVD